MKCSHHGSKHSSSDEFIEALNPQVAFISCGFGNTHGHPDPELVERLNSAISLQRFYMTNDRDEDTFGERVHDEGTPYGDKAVVAGCWSEEDGGVGESNVKGHIQLILSQEESLRDDPTFRVLYSNAKGPQIDSYN